MRVVVKALLAVTVFAALTAFGCLYWFYFYSGDLPSVSTLTKLAPNSPATVFDQCSNTPIQVIPATGMGKNLRNAAHAAEGESDQILALQISRDLFCNSRMKSVKRHVLEYKASVQLRRRFTSEQLLTIYLNRAYFGKDLIGVETASLHYFGKHAADLDISEAALISGLMKAPNMYSPERHATQAKERRDSIIDAMLKNGSITPEEASAARQSNLR